MAEQLKQTFREADVEGRGTIARRELQRILVQASREPPEVSEQLLAAFSPRGSGDVRYEAFIDWLSAPQDGGVSGGVAPPPSPPAPPASGPSKAQSSWSAAAWLRTLGGDGRSICELMGAALAGSGDADSQLARLRRIPRSGRREQILSMLQGSLGEIADVVAQGIDDLEAAGGGGAEVNDKFRQCKDVIKLGFGNLKSFFEGLEGLIGTPAPKVLEAMYREHCCEEDSDTSFTTGNYGICTTSRKEFTFVVAPELGPEVKLEFEEVQRLVDEFREGLAEAPECGVVDRASVAAAIEAGVEEMLRETAEDTAGGWPVELEERLKDHRYRRRPRCPSAFLEQIQTFNRLLAASDESGLTDVEFFGARLYTGPLFVKYNAVLRALTKVPFLVNQCAQLCGLNRYVTTLHVINSALLKLSKVQPAERVYRGLSGCSLPEEMLKPNDFGVCGGVEYAFMSTTTDRSVAMHYASGAGKAGIVFEIQLGMVDRGASLRWLSQYPHEAEICFGPLSGLQVVGTRVEKNVLVVEMRLNVNMQSLTIEQVISKRRKGIMDLCTSLKTEVRAELARVTDAAMPSCQGADLAKLKRVLEGKVAERFAEVCGLDAERFNDDGEYERLFNSCLRSRRAVTHFIDATARGAKELFEDGPEVYSGMRPLFAALDDPECTEDPEAPEWWAMQLPDPAAAAFNKVIKDAEDVGQYLRPAKQHREHVVGGPPALAKAAMDELHEMLVSCELVRKHFEHDRELWLACQVPAAAHLASEKMWADREVVAAIVDLDYTMLRWASEELRGSREFVRARMEQNPVALQGATRDCTLEILREDGCCLKYTSQTLRDDEEAVMAAVGQNGHALTYATDGAKQNRTLVLHAVRQNGHALIYALEALKSDRELVLEAVRQDGNALQYASKALRGDREVALAAVAQVGEALRHAEEPLRGDKAVVLAALQQAPVSSERRWTKRELFERLLAPTLREDPDVRRAAGLASS